MQKGWKVFSHLNGKSRKKLLACLLSISMIPVNGFTVMAATADQGNQAAVTQEGTNHTNSYKWNFICGRIPECNSRKFQVL